MSRRVFHADPARPTRPACGAPGPPPGITIGSGAGDSPVAGSTVTGNDTTPPAGSRQSAGTTSVAQRAVAGKPVGHGSSVNEAACRADVVGDGSGDGVAGDRVDFAEVLGGELETCLTAPSRGLVWEHPVSVAAAKSAHTRLVPALRRSTRPQYSSLPTQRSEMAWPACARPAEGRAARRPTPSAGQADRISDTASGVAQGGAGIGMGWARFASVRALRP
jgi:hypothetical protein